MRRTGLWAWVVVTTLVGTSTLHAVSNEPPASGSMVSTKVLDVAATPATVYRLLLDYEGWPRTFSQVREARMVDGQPENAIVQIKAASFKEPYRLGVSAVREEKVVVELLDGKDGTRVHAWLRMMPVEKGTRLVVRVQSRVGGTFAHFWPDFMVRKVQERVVSGLLSDFEKALARSSTE